MRRLRLVISLLAGLMVVPQPAVGLVCPTDQTMTPEQVLRGGLVSGEQRYDLAMVARVSSVEDEGMTQTAQVAVFAVYGLASAPGTATVTFEDLADVRVPVDSLIEGASYFIPVTRAGPAGEPNYATSCEPISEVSQPETTALELAGVAAESGLEFSLPLAEGNGDGAASAAVLVVLLILLVWTLSRVRRNRDGFSGTGSDPRRRPEPPR